MASLLDRKLVLITVAINEVMTKEVCPHVPYGAEEVARSAIEAARAGAAGVHMHARHHDGRQDFTGDEIYRRAMELTAAASDIPIWTTAYPIGPDPTSLDDVPHQWALTDNPPKGAPLRFGCFDAFRVGQRPAWSEHQRKFIPMTKEWALDPDSEYDTPVILAEMLRRGLSPVVCCYDFGDARWASCAMSSGMLPDPSLVQLQIFGGLVIGPSPTVQNLEAYIAEARSASEPELSFAGFQFSTRDHYEEMLRIAVQNGCHIRVGLGDAGHLYPELTNAQLVGRAVDIVQSLGYEPATPADMLARFCPPVRAGQAQVARSGRRP